MSPDDLGGRGDNERLVLYALEAERVLVEAVGGFDSSLDCLIEEDLVTDVVVGLKLGLGDLGTLTLICRVEVDTVSKRGSSRSPIFT